MNAPELPVTYSTPEVCEALGISTGQLTNLVRDGKVGFIVGKRNTKRFLPEHVAQIREAIEVHPRKDDDAFTRIGVTRRAARRRAG